MKKIIPILVIILAFASDLDAQAYSFQRDMYLGSAGSDVAELQTFLMGQGYNIPAVAAGFTGKGYFGYQTRDALARFQVANGIPGTGYFGPLTRQKLNQGIGTGTGGTGGGVIPGDYRGYSLRVVTPNGGEYWQKGATQNISWTGSQGLIQGTATLWLQPYVPPCAEETGPIRCMIAVQSPYLISSSINLNAQSYPWVVGNAFVDATAQMANIADGQYKIRICPNVGGACDVSDQYFNITSQGGVGTTGNLAIVSPNGGESWQKGTIQSITWTSPAYFRATYADLKLVPYVQPCTYICPLSLAVPYTIASGLSINNNAYSWVVGNVQATYGNFQQTVPDGQYQVQICDSGTNNCDSSNSYFSIYGTTGGGGGGVGYNSPVIHGVDAPTNLQASQTGTWTVRASDPQGGTLSYSVDWGDQAYAQPQSAFSSAGQFVQTTTFTHAYARAGTYTVTFTVRNSFGLTQQTQSTVNVGSATDPNTQFITVQSPNGGEIWKRGTQQTIRWTGYTNNYWTNNGYVRITLNYQCPSNMFCTAIAHPTYMIQTSAPNNGSSAWLVGSATVDGVNAISVPNGTFIVTVCRYDAGSQPTSCDSSNSTFTVTD